MDILQRSGASTFFFLAGIQLLDMRRLDLLQSHFSHQWQDMILCNLPVLKNHPGPSGYCFPIQPGCDEAFKRHLSSFEGKSAIDFAERLLHPIPAFLLRLAVLGQALPV